MRQMILEDEEVLRSIQTTARVMVASAKEEL